MGNNENIDNNKVTNMLKQTAKDILDKKIYDDNYLENLVNDIYDLENKSKNISIEYRAWILIEVLQSEIIDENVSAIIFLLDNIVNCKIPLFTSTLLKAIEISSYQLNYRGNTDKKEKFYNLLFELFRKVQNTICRYNNNNFSVMYDRYINSVKILPDNDLRDLKYVTFRYNILSYMLNLNIVYSAINDSEKDYLSLLRTGQLWGKSYFD